MQLLLLLLLLLLAGSRDKDRSSGTAVATWLFLFFGIYRGLGGRNVAVISRWVDAASGSLVEDQSRRTAHQPRIAALATPVAFARAAQRYVAVGVVFTQRVFLAVLYKLGPVARVCLLVEE